MHLQPLPWDFDCALDPDTLSEEDVAVENNLSPSEQLGQDDTPVAKISSKLKDAETTLISCCMLQLGIKAAKVFSPQNIQHGIP